MAKRFRDLLKDLPPERRRRVETRKRQVLREVTLAELRRALKMTQQELAEALDLRQATVSKIENQSDMYISTPRRILAGMGGRLRVLAEFPGGEMVAIGQFDSDAASANR